MTSTTLKPLDRIIWSADVPDGATRLVIGRPITVGDPAENLQSIADSIRAAA